MRYIARRVLLYVPILLLTLVVFLPVRRLCSVPQQPARLDGPNPTSAGSARGGSAAASSPLSRARLPPANRAGLLDPRPFRLDLARHRDASPQRLARPAIGPRVPARPAPALGLIS
jgi:hypothetical protein